LSSRGDSAGEQPRRRAARCSLELVLHSAADRFEELVSGSWRPPGATGSDAMFVGFLESVDSTRLYGACIGGAPHRSHGSLVFSRTPTTALASS
jgi:hypothetical protein